MNSSDQSIAGPSASKATANDVGLLVLRLGVGLSMAIFFGLTKLHDASTYLHTGQWSFVDFNRKVGLPAPLFVAYLQTINESLGAILVAVGFLTRWATAWIAFSFAVATGCSLKVGEPAWMMAAYFCLMFTTLALTGPGRFSIDGLRH